MTLALSAAFSLLFFFPSSSKETVSVSILQRKQPALPQDVLDPSFNGDSRARSETEKQRYSAFDEDGQLRHLKNQVLQSGSFISLKKRRQYFQESGLDTAVNAAAAKRVILASYSAHPNEDEITKRVIALNMLRYSSHLKEEDCAGLMDSLVSQYNAPSSAISRQSVQLDFGSIVYACATLTPRDFLRRIDQLQDPELKAQSHLALEKYKEDAQNDQG